MDRAIIDGMRAWLMRSIHISWFIAWASAGILAGVAAAGVLHTYRFDVVWLIVLAAFLLGGLVRRRTAFILLAVLFGLALGLWRGSLEQSALQRYEPFYGQTVSVQGKVSEDVTQSTAGNQEAILTDVTINGEPMAGQTWVGLLTSRADIQRSDTITVSGKLKTGFGNIPASMSFAHLVARVRPQPGDVALHVRDWFSGGIRRAVPEPQASLGIGYLLGQRSALPASLDNDFKIIGLTHAVVASGYNLTILAVFARRAFLKKSKYLAMLSAALLAAGFLLITGFSPSMTRAAIVMALGLGAWYYGRTVHPLVLLPLAAAITVLVNPAYAWGDIGWSLSFAAFASVLVLAPLLHRFLWDTKKPGILREILVDTMAAQLATMPIMIFAFGNYSLYALAANLLILPLIPITMVLTLAAGVAGLAVPGVAHIVGWPAALILRYMTWTVDTIAGLPGAASSLSFGALALALSYAGLLLAIILLQRKTLFNFRNAAVTEAEIEI